MPARSIAALALLLGACGPAKPGDEAASTTAVDTDDSTTGEHVPTCPESAPTTGGGPSDVCPERPTTDACCCFVVGGLFWQTESLCEIHELCPPIELECADAYLDCDPTLLSIRDEAPLDCTLAALASGAAGRVSWEIVGGFGFTSTLARLDLAGDGAVFRQLSEREDLSAKMHDVTRHPLPSPAYFADCLADPSWLARFLCVQSATACAARETCLAGYTCSLGLGCPGDGTTGE